MADEETDETPAVELGMGTPVEDAPLARVTSRLTWPQEKSSILNKESDAIIHTPDGPQSLGGMLTETDKTCFDTRQAFIDDVFDIAGCDSVQTG